MEMKKYSLVYTTCPSLLCFLSMSFGKRMVVVGIVDALNEKGYNVGHLVSAV
jgi:hypothetical protein